MATPIVSRKYPKLLPLVSILYRSPGSVFFKMDDGKWGVLGDGGAACEAGWKGFDHDINSYRFDGWELNELSGWLDG